MSRQIHGELFLFLKAVGTGAFFLFFYDFLWAFSMIFPKSGITDGIRDIFFWISCALGFFWLLDQGKARGFIFGGILFGVWLNAFLFHTFVKKMWTGFWCLPIKLVKKIRNRLLFTKKKCRIFMYIFIKSKNRGDSWFYKLKRGKKSEK